MSLGTKDHREAKARAGPIIERFEAVIVAADVGGERLTQRDIEALCGEWYRDATEMWGDDPATFGDLDIYQSLLGDQVEDTEESSAENPVVKLTPLDREEARRLLASYGSMADSVSVDRLAEALFWTKARFVERRGAAGGRRVS